MGHGARRGAERPHQRSGEAGEVEIAQEHLSWRAMSAQLRAVRLPAGAESLGVREGLVLARSVTAPAHSPAFMTLQDFIAIWQAQPFRAFRIHAPSGVLTVGYPLATALTADMRVAGITDDGRCRLLALE